jgi:uncharacterized membrane protein
VTEASPYISLAARERYVSQAWRVWAAGFFVVALWVATIIAAPVAKANGLIGLSFSIYSFFSFLCHQISDRSLHIEGEQLAVCSRCFGVYFGLLFGFAIYPFWRHVEDIEPLPKVWLFLSLVPITIDWSLTVFGIWENTHLSRFLTGLILGVACASFIVPSIVEITRNFTFRRS